MRKKWILWVTCLALTLGTYTGCSKSSDEPQTQPEETIEQETEQTEDPQEESKESEQAEETNEQEEAGSPEEKETAKAEEPKEEQPAAETKETPQTSPAPAPAEEQPAPAPEEPAAEEPQGIADGTYSISIGFSGGTGKASITSPVTLYVKNGTYSAKVVWTSMYYDYMKVGGTKYTNENVGGNSTFTIPVPALDTYFTVIGDTTAMSSPHEIEYTLYFDSTTLK